MHTEKTIKDGNCEADLGEGKCFITRIKLSYTKEAYYHKVQKNKKRAASRGGGEGQSHWDMSSRSPRFIALKVICLF